MALALYLATTLALSFVWSRWVQRVSRGAVLALIALPLLFTGRAMLTGRVYAPIDLPFTAEPLRDYAADFGITTPHNIALSDLHCQIIPWQQSVRHALAQGEWPLWNPFILNGDILAAAAQPAVYDPLNLLALVLPLPHALTFGATMTFFLAAFFTFALARSLGLREVASLLAAAGFAFCGMMAFFVGWPLARSWAYLPLVLFAVCALVRQSAVGSRQWAGKGPTLLLTIAFVLVIVSGHPESVLHIISVGAVFGLSLRPRLRAVAQAVIAGLLALLLTAIYLLPFAEAVPETLDYKIRRELYAPTSYDVIVSAKTRRERMVRTFVPFLDDSPSTPGWDPLSARVGPILLLLAAAAPIVAASAWWRNRSAVRSEQSAGETTTSEVLPTAHCPLPTASPTTDNRQPTTTFWLLLAVVALLATFGMKPVAHALHALPLFDIAINERLAFAAALALSMLAAITVDRIPNQSLALLLLALVLVERSLEDGGVYPALPKEVFYPRVPLIDAIPRDARIAGTGTALIPANAALYGLEDSRGYNAMTYRRLYETYPLWATYQRAWFNRIDDLSRPFLSFLNVRYALTTTEGEVPAGWRVLATERQSRLLENDSALPRAFVPKVVRYVRENPVEEMKEVQDFRETAWIETPLYEPHQTANGPGRVTIRRSGLAYELEASMESDGWVVVSETAWPGWRAYVDGRRAQVHFANHAFLGVHVPRGSHRLRLRYLPESFTRGRAISGITLLLLVAAGVCYRTGVCSRSFSTSRSPSL